MRSNHCSNTHSALLGLYWLCCVELGEIVLAGPSTATTTATSGTTHALISNIVATTTSNIVRFVGTVVKHPGNPLMNQTEPWEMSGINNGYPTVIYRNNVRHASSCEIRIERFLSLPPQIAPPVLALALAPALC